MKYRLEKRITAYTLIVLSGYTTLVAMSNAPRAAQQKSITLLCPDGELEISRAMIHLLPVIEDLVNDMNTDQAPLIFNKDAVIPIINAVKEIHALLETLQQETLQKYSITKTYTPDDIPLHVRRSIKLPTTRLNPQQFANVLECANYMLAPYLVNALAGEWVLKNFEPKQDELNSKDVMTFITKYRAYAKDTIYYECSIADLLLTSRTHRGYNTLETELTKEQPTCTIPLLLPMKEYMPEKPIGNAIITSLVGWEFLHKKVSEYPKHLAITQKTVARAPLMIYDTKFYDIDETDSSLDEEELIMESKDIQYTIPTLKSYTFLGLPSLTHIQLNNLGIVTVKDNAFAALPKVQEMDLRNNSITTFPTTGLSKGIKKVNLSGNPLFPGECKQLEARFGNDTMVNCNK